MFEFLFYSLFRMEFIAIIILSLLPSLYHIFKEKEERQRIWGLIKKKWLNY